MHPFKNSLHKYEKTTDVFFKNVFMFNYITPHLNKNLLFSKDLVSNLPSFDNWEKEPFNVYQNRLKKTNEIVDKKEINDLNFRCDNFTNVHNGKHIVFTGCSNTWGTGLKKEEIWAYKTYEKISKDIKCSGYFNLGILGSSIQSQIVNLFKYFNKYGNPDIIFINFPDLLRFYGYNNKDDLFLDTFYTKESKEILSLITFQSYFMLDQYCKSNKIKLYSFSWIHAEQKTPIGHKIFDLPLKSFDTYYEINKDDMENFVSNVIDSAENKDYLKFARDDEHPGTAYNEYWSNFIYEKYIKDL